MTWSRIRPVIARLYRSLCFLPAFILLSIGNGGSDCDHAALGRDARLGLSALDNFYACMRKFGRFEHRAQTRAATCIAKRRERDDDYRGNDHDRHVTMPACRIEAATAGSTAANIAKRAIVLEL